MKGKFLLAILLLPGNVLIFIPGLIIFISGSSKMAPRPVSPFRVEFWLALALASTGFLLILSTVRLFLTKGQGTPAPWEPPKKLVVKGPYRYVRNPMISGVLLLLGAESLGLQSALLAFWTGLFFLGNAVYFPLIEEKGLQKRFGAEYTEYKKHVPRWIPRLKPWNRNEPSF